MRILTLPNSPATQIIIVENSAAVAAEGARRFVDLAHDTLARQDRFCVALSGGTTPKAMHALLASPPLRQLVDWTRVHVFWGDERFVPPDHPESAYRMAKDTLLDHVPIPSANVHPMATAGCTPEQAAQRYSADLKSFLASDPPRLDLIFLGLGPDGHTASLFPGFPQLVSPATELVSVVSFSPKPPPIRLTLTFPILNQAAHVVFLADGAGKADALRQVFAPSVPVRIIPAKGVRPTQGVLTWILDEAAAAKLSLASAAPRNA